MTYKEICDKIANEFNKRGIEIKNLKTGLIVKTGEDVYNFDSHGELFHVWQWYAMLWPESVDENGAIHFYPEKENQK